jgi:tetratricopeptide (TPR) repeat protein
MNDVLLDLDTPRGFIDAVVNHGVSWAGLHGVADEQLEDVYRRAYDDAMAGQHAAALERFAWLVRNKSSERRYLFGFALCLQFEGQFEAAGRFYAQAWLADATDASCPFRIGECMGALGHLGDAREAFESAVKLSWLNPEFDEVREHALRRLDQLTAVGQ